MPYTVKWIVTPNESLSEEERQKMFSDFNAKILTEEHQVAKTELETHIEAETKAGNILARGSVIVDMEIHTVAVWKSKAAFQRSFNSPSCQNHAKLMERYGWKIQKIEPVKNK